MLSRREFLQALTLVFATSSNLTLADSLKIDSTEKLKTSKVLLKTIPKTGEKIPAIGMGTARTFHVDINNKNEMQQRVQVLQNFFTAGGGMIDSSPMYANAEEVLGLCFDQMQKDSFAKDLFTASKVWSVTEQAGLKEYIASENQWREKQFDLMQVHNLLNWPAHLKNLQTYKKEKRLRYVGITTSHQRRHKEFLEIMQTQDIDFVQFSYSLANRKAEKVLLPAAQENNLAVIINRGFQTGHLFKKVADKPLPEWAKEIQVNSWAQFFLKFIISHPAVTVVIPATTDPAHMLENMQAMHGAMPDEKMRAEMVNYFESVTA